MWFSRVEELKTMMIKTYNQDVVVPDSGMYFELMSNGQIITKVTCIKGEKFPPTLCSGNYYEPEVLAVNQPKNMNKSV